MWGIWEGEHAGGVIKEKAYARLVGSTVRGIKMMKEEQGTDWRERGRNIKSESTEHSADKHLEEPGAVCRFSP